jgi:hypothetical protein
MIPVSPALPRALACLFAALLLHVGFAPAAGAQVRRVKFEAGGKYLVLEALDDDLIHFEVAAGRSPGPSTPLRTSPMVHEPTSPTIHGGGRAG